jgi:hypothetical protein
VWVAVAVAIVIPRAPRRAAVVLAGCAAAWTAIVAGMAQRGYAGLPRFLFMATGLWAVVAGIGAGCLAVELLRIAGRIRPLGRRRLAPGLAATVAALAVGTAFAYGSAPAAQQLEAYTDVIGRVARMDARLARQVQAAGGVGAVVRCGRPRTPWYTRTALAWDLDVSPTYVGTLRQSDPGRAQWTEVEHRSSRRQPILLRRAPACGHRRV